MSHSRHGKAPGSWLTCFGGRRRLLLQWKLMYLTYQSESGLQVLPVFLSAYLLHDTPGWHILPLTLNFPKSTNPQLIVTTEMKLVPETHSELRGRGVGVSGPPFGLVPTLRGSLRNKTGRSVAVSPHCVLPHGSAFLWLLHLLLKSQRVSSDENRIRALTWATSVSGKARLFLFSWQTGFYFHIISS